MNDVNGNKKIRRNGFYTGERAEFAATDLFYEKCTFTDGESPLKESERIDLNDCVFGWKYPLWYTRSALVKNTLWQKTARSGVWYADSITLEDCTVDAPKNFRRCVGVKISNTTFSEAQETLWSCENVSLNGVTVCGDYFGMNCKNVEASGLKIDGNYCFDGAENVVITNAVLNSKDSFWNTKNVIVKDSVIVGEYIGWNSQNLTFVNCRIESNQGFCYIKGLRFENCDIEGTTLCFEYCSDVCANLKGKVDSVKNPISGEITADEFGEIIMESDKVDVSATKIVARKKA